MSSTAPDIRKRPRWGLLALIALLHLVALAGLMRVFAPTFTSEAIERVGSLVTVTVYTPPPEPEVRTPEPDRGAAGEEAAKATAREVAAPRAPVPRPSPAPRAASTGQANASGAREAGEGTGAGGVGAGTGSGNAGQGAGGGAPTRPEKIAGDIRSAADYPIPPGGREARFGQSVTIAMTVGIDGRASNCRVARPSNDPVADRITCELAIARFRFKPATDADGNPVPATYGWRQDFFQSR